MFIYVFIYLFESKVTLKERKRELHLLFPSLNSRNGQLCWVKTWNQDLLSNLPRAWRVPSTWNIFSCFPRGVNRDNIRSRAIEYWTSAQLGCKNSRRNLNSLCQDSGFRFQIFHDFVFPGHSRWSFRKMCFVIPFFRESIII